MWARERQRYTEGGTASCRGREPESSRRLTLTRYAIDLLVWVHSKSLTLELNSWRLHLEKQMWIWSTPITSFSLSSPPSPPPPQPKIHKVSLQTSMREWKVYVVEKQNISLLLRSECLHANVCCCLFVLYIIYVCCVVVPSLDEDACRASERERSFICVCLKTICLGVKTRFTSLTFYMKRLVTLSSVLSPSPLLFFSSPSHPLPVFSFCHFLCAKRDIQHLWFTEAVMYNSGVITSLMNWPWGGPRLLITLH